ncbi:MAG: twin-arginine translocase TatA/TatE family subunit [Deltaproteobacteria bacterium]|nr:twin-arginine translocase TatA/TatE family subunit [Deltaproteobacteria bacterium]
MFGFGMGELVVVLVIVLLLFGPRRLPDLGEALGKGLRDFQRGLKTPTEIDVTPSSSPLTEAKKSDKE